MGRPKERGMGRVKDVTEAVPISVDAEKKVSQTYSLNVIAVPLTAVNVKE